MQRNAAQIEHRQHGRVAELELQREADHVESPERRAALDGEERLLFRTQSRFHVGPRHEEALAGDVGALVERVVEEAEADVAHPDFIGVGEGERPGDARLRKILVHGVQLAAGVARRLLRREDQAVEDGKPHGRHV